MAYSAGQLQLLPCTYPLCHCCCITAALLQALYGGAVNGQEPDGLVEMYGCTLTANSASDKGGAVHVESDAFTFRATDTLFIDNTVSVC